MPLVFKMFIFKFFVYFLVQWSQIIKKIGPDIAYKCLSLSEFECR